MIYSTWAWNVICAPDVFTWNFAFMLLNMAQVFHVLYQLRPVKFDPELEEVYHNLFEPFKVGNLDFYKKNPMRCFRIFIDTYCSLVVMMVCQLCFVKYTRVNHIKPEFPSLLFFFSLITFPNVFHFSRYLSSLTQPFV